MRVRVRCAGTACGHRFTVSGGVRNAKAEAERRRAFFETLIALTPLVGIARARDRAIEASGIHFTTASRHLARGVIGSEFRQYRGEVGYYSVLEQVVRVYGLAHRRQSDFPARDLKRPDPALKKVHQHLLWLLLSRARGIAALVLGLPQPEFGEPAPAAFPSWIDRGARGIDPLRRHFPPSRHSCATEILEYLHRTLVAETPDGYWNSLAARDWLRTKVVPAMSLVSHGEQRLWGRGAEPQHADRWDSYVEGLNQDPPPVPDPSLVFRLLDREVREARRLSADALVESVDDGLGYWVETTGTGTVLGVRVTLGRRTVGRAEAQVAKPFREADNAARLRLIAEDRKGNMVKLIVGRERVNLPWRSPAGADYELMEQLVWLPPPTDRQSGR